MPGLIAYDGLVNKPTSDDPWNDPWYEPPRDAPPTFHDLPQQAKPTQTHPPQYAPTSNTPDATTATEIIPAGSAIRLYLAWVIIIVGMFGIAYMQYKAMNSPELLEADSSPGFGTIYLGRVSVGINEVWGVTDPSYLAQMDGIAQTSQYQTTNTLRTAIVAGELYAREDAVWRLESVLPQSDAAWNPPSWPDDHEMSTGQVQADHALLTRIYSDEQYQPDPDEQAQLIENHGWFGKLAGSYNLPESHPARQAPRRSAKHVILFLVVFVGTAAAALLVGIGLLVTMIVLLSMGKLETRMPTGPPAHRTAYLEVLAVFFICFVLFQIPVLLVMELFEVDLTLALLLGLVLPIFWPLLFGVKFRRFCQDMGWTAPQGVLREIAAGLGGYVAGLPVIGIGMAITILLATVTQQSADHPIGHEIVRGDLMQIITLILAAVVWAPLVEESIFRAALYRHIRRLPRWTGWVLATLISSFIFAAIHPQGYVGIPALMSIAFVLAGLREWRQSLIPSITAHALHNGALVTMLLVVLYL